MLLFFGGWVPFVISELYLPIFSPVSKQGRLSASSIAAMHALVWLWSSATTTTTTAATTVAGLAFWPLEPRGLNEHQT